MTIKEVTKKMLLNIREAKFKKNNYERIKDKDIALALNLTAASFSRLITGVTTPQIQTWAKICKMHSLMCGDRKTHELINKLEY